MNAARTYFRVAAALLVLLALTVGVAFVNLGPMNTPVAMLIALAKAGLVAVFFMHLRGQSGLVRLCAGAGLFWLGILFALALSDYLTRSAGGG